MDIVTFLNLILTNASAIGVVTISIIGTAVFVWALATERLYLGKSVKRTFDRIVELEPLVRELTDELQTSKVLAAQSLVRIEFLEKQAVERGQQIEDLRIRIQSVERERDRILATWRPPLSEQDARK